MKREILVVDAYNIINAWPELKKIAEEDFDSSRKKLLEILSNYQGFMKNKVIVVFDAHMVLRGKRKKLKYDQIEVVFTKEGETADHYIEKLAKEFGQNTNMRVATSDALQQTIVLGQGATRISARELLIEVEQVALQIRKKLQKHSQQQRNNAFVEALSEELYELFEKMRRM